MVMPVINFVFQFKIEKWQIALCNKSKPQKFINDLMQALYTHEYMATHSLTGAKSSSSKDKAAKPAMNQNEVQEIIGDDLLTLFNVALTWQRAFSERGPVTFNSWSTQVMCCFIFPSLATYFYKPSVTNTVREMLISSISIVSMLWVLFKWLLRHSDKVNFFSLWQQSNLEHDNG